MFATRQYLMLGLVAALAAPIALAQGGGGQGQGQGGQLRQQAQQQREAQQQRRVTAEQRREAQERMRERWKNMSPEQKARFLERREERLERRYGMLDSAGRQTWAREMQQERDRLRAQVDSGKVTPEQAREQMRDWMRRTLPAPDSARGRPPR